MNVSGRRNWYSKDEQGDNTMQVMNNSSSLMALGELKQSAQAMLAQSNQNLGKVLNLLQ